MVYRITDIQNKKVWGRCGSDGEDLVLFWTASGLELNVKASYMDVEIDAMYENMELWLDVFIDDERLMRFPLKKGKEKYQVLRSFDKNTETKVRISRNTQSMPEDAVSLIKICQIDTDAEFLPVTGRDYNLEFIGDSITSGEGGAALTRAEWISTVFDPTNGYTKKTAELLNAEYNVVSQSGWGLYSSWDGNTDCVLPKVYKYYCGSQKSEKALNAGAGKDWDFASQSKKDAVIINLGTNDGTGMQLDKWTDEDFKKSFIQCGIQFLEDVRKCNPSSKIVWAYGMLGNVMEADIRQAIDEYNKKTGGCVYYVALPNCGEEYLGARMHPNPKGHTMAAEKLAGFLKSIL